MSDAERLRLVILGSAGVGKSCIVKRFLFSAYSDKYRPTVEDLYNREYDLGPGASLKVDILDTAGDQQFPAMRRLCIATAHAFLLVYATTSAGSLQGIKRCFEEVREQRADFQDIPIVVAGNKMDLAKTHREVRLEDVSEWVFCELPRLRAKVMECSAKDDVNIREIFRSFLTLSRILPTSGVGVGGDGGLGSGLKRRSSAHVKSGRRGVSPSVEASASTSASCDGASVSGGSLDVAKAKPRSRSLIRRSSRKTKQQMRDAQDECHVS